MRLEMDNLTNSGTRNKRSYEVIETSTTSEEVG